MKNLDYLDYLSFLGAIPERNRKGFFNEIQDELPSDAAKFWKKNVKLVQRGVLYQGAMERISTKLAYLVTLFRRKKIARLFTFKQIEEQRHFIENEWDTPLFRKFIRFLLNPKLTRLWIKDPGLYEYVDPASHPGDYIYGRMNDSLMRHLAKENLILSFLFLGKVGSAAFPPYLTHEGTNAIRPRLDRITVKAANIVDFLENEPEQSYNVFSISDVASYINDDEYLRLLEAIYKTAKPGARFCLRQFLSARTLPKWCQDKLVRNTELEKKLEKEDRTFLYKFLVGEVKK